MFNTKIDVVCLECALSTQQHFRSDRELENSGVYKTKCPNGHEAITILQNSKFEILFHIGCLALRDGYYREAIGTFSTALERFFEFCSLIFLHAKKIDKNDTESFWKVIDAQSERQLGAFLALYLVTIGKPYEYVDQKKITLRNKVVHRGYIPDHSEVVEFGEWSYNAIVKTLLMLKKDFSKDLQQQVFFEMQKKIEEAERKHPEVIANLRSRGRSHSVMQIPTAIDIPSSDLGSKSFAQRLSDFSALKCAPSAGTVKALQV